jgi:hypothetical protein
MAGFNRAIVRYCLRCELSQETGPQARDPRRYHPGLWLCDVITNVEQSQMGDTNDQWIVERTGMYKLSRATYNIASCCLTTSRRRRT